MKKRPRGRPPKPVQERLIQDVHIRLTIPMVDALFVEAHRAGMSLAELIRQRLSVAPKKMDPETGPIMEA